MLWKIYFWIIIVLMSLSYFDTFMLGMSIADIFDIPITLISTIAFFGYVYKKPFLNSLFWKRWFYIMITWDVFYGVLILDYSEFSNISISEAFAMVMIGLVLILPLYIAIYLYGYKSIELWEKPNEKKIYAS